MLSCEFCEIFKNTFFTEHLWTSASLILKYEILIVRSSHQRCSILKGALKSFTKFTGKYLCQSPFFNVATLIKKRFWQRCSPVNFVKFLRPPFLQDTYGLEDCFPIVSALPIYSLIFTFAFAITYWFKK